MEVRNVTFVLSFKKPPNITEIHSFVIAKSVKCECSFLSRDIKPNQLEHTPLRVPKKTSEIDFLKSVNSLHSIYF